MDVGSRPAEFVTIDGLLNHLGLLGISLDARSVEAATALRGRVTAIFGDVELVGIADGRGARLYLVLPDLRMIGLHEELNLRPYRVAWGGHSAAAIDTARLLIARCCSRRWGPDEEMLTQALVYNFLASAGAVFSLNANSLSDWCLLDGDLTTNLGPAEHQRIQLYEPGKMGMSNDAE